ncbi:MAG TPA: leucyl/phenylalanyl-tRNA--protein transferase [Micropepsaceae bacterium]
MISVTAINPEELLLAYRLGIFPMAESRTAKDVLWVRPHERGILPLDKFHVPKRLARVVRSNRFHITADAAFEDVIRACAESRPERRETWINDAILDVFISLHKRGFAHSIETWHGDRLVGGLYGLSLSAAFFAESKFSRATDASKVALVHLAARLKAGGYTLLDAQFPNPHLEQFGAATVTEERFQFMLARALAASGDFYGLGRAGVAPDGAAGAPVTEGGDGGAVPAAGADSVAGSSVLQVITHTS